MTLHGILANGIAHYPGLLMKAWSTVCKGSGSWLHPITVEVISQIVILFL